MASEWRHLTLDGVIEIISGGTPKTSIPEYWDGDIPWLSVADFNRGYRWVSSAEKSITRLGLEQSATTLLLPGDIIISARGTVGALAQLAIPMAFNQSCYGIRGREGIAINDYLYYALRAAVSQMMQVAHGGVFNTITRDTFRVIEIDLPPLPEQRAISHILGTLDDKIELNRNMNETLEEMARAIFKSWFIDFDPVRAKAAGRDPGLPKPIADLFPDSFVDSELGEIPKGWKVGKLGEILEFAYGKGLKDEIRLPGRIPVYGSNGVVGYHNEALVKGPGIVIGRKGTAGTVTWAHTDFFPIDTTFYVVPTSGIKSMIFFYYLLRREDLAGQAADSAVPGLNRNLAYMNPIVVPPSELCDRYESRVITLYERMFACMSEAATLASVRDALLPKLISGELRVGDAEKLTTEAQ